MRSDTRYRRSPFLLARWDYGDVVITDCQHARDYRAKPTVVNVLSRLDEWRSLDELREKDARLSQKTLDSLLERHLIQAWRTGESEPPSDLHHWNLFDLAVQRRSNTGGYFPTGADSAGPPPAALKLTPEGARRVFPPPSGLSMRLDAALARRRSIRTYGQRPVDLCEFPICSITRSA